MFVFDENYKNSLNAAWKKFINNEEYDYSFMRPEILESWKRSRKFLVNPYRSKTTVLNSEDLEQRMASNALLIDTVIPYMDKLYSIVEGSGFYLLLCDNDGYILHLTGDRDMIEQGKNTLLVVGANRSESFAGTNAIGTSLAIKKPIQIWHGEHYIIGHQAYTCSAAPIFNEKQELLGCLNLTGRYTEAHTHTLGMVISAVDGISKEMQIRTAYNEISAISAQRNSIIQAVHAGLILLNHSDQIIQINKSALDMLNLTYESSINRNISDLITIQNIDPNFGGFSTLKKEMNDREVNIHHAGISLPPEKFSISAYFVDDCQGKKIGTLIKFTKAEKIFKLVNKFSGYKSSFTFESIIGTDSLTQSLINTCKRAAKSDSNILILGESGTGKEMLAQSIHAESNYAKGPFVAINCGALPKGLIESELFGYERGAFTGANKEGNPGKFELADGGTIFLDEIGDMPLDVQVSLLRVIQNREVVRIGAKYPKKIDVRIIAATNQDLLEGIKAKTFREDLYFRLNVFTINVPPLRDRGNDVTELAEHFVNTYNDQKGTSIAMSSEVYNILTAYPWPGNVRELENAIERAINFTDDNQIRLEHFSTRIREFISNSNEQAKYGVPDQPKHLSEEGHSVPPEPPFNLESTGYQLILSSLETTKGNIKEAAELLGISRRTLYRKLEKYGISSDIYRSND